MIIARKQYEDNFCKGFLYQNTKLMKFRKFLIEKEDVYGVGLQRTEKIGNINKYYISSVDIPLRTLLPPECRLSNYFFTIHCGTHVFFDLVARLGDSDLSEYIQNKVIFHEKLVTGLARDWYIDKTNLVFIFCFNGADNVPVTKVFNDICSKCGIRGVTVYIASDVVNRWELELKVTECDKRIAECKLELELDEYSLYHPQRHSIDFLNL